MSEFRFEVCPHCEHDIELHYVSVTGVVRCRSARRDINRMTGDFMEWVCICRDYKVDQSAASPPERHER